MTVTLEPELARELSQKAAAQGQDADAYLRQLIQTALRQPVPPIIRSSLSKEEFLESWQQWTASNDSNAPPISNEALRRENMYDDEV